MALLPGDAGVVIPWAQVLDLAEAGGASQCVELGGAQRLGAGP